MKLISYAQNQEDIVLYRALRAVQRGFYIDVGAQQPVTDSVTKLFYERGWSGINIDPVPQWFEALQVDRPHDVNLRLAAGSAPGQKVFYAIADTGLSTDDASLAQQHAQAGFNADALEVEVRTLDDICAEYRVDTVHFLKIDVEGAETEVIRGFSFDRIRPWIVLVEAVAPVAMREGDDMSVMQETHQEWEPLLLAHRYHHVYSDGLNRFYLAEEHLHLRAALSVPANPLDAFIRNEEWKKYERIVQLDGEVRQLTAVTQATEQWVEQRTEQRLREEQREEALRALTAVVKSRMRRIAVLERKLRDKEEALREHQAQLVDTRREREHYYALSQQIMHSRSWRLTAPLRAISRFMSGKQALSREESPPARPLPRRVMRKFLLFCLGVAGRHPRLHRGLRAIYSRIPGVRGRLSAFARNNLAHADPSGAKSVSMIEAWRVGDEPFPTGAADVHRRLKRQIEEQRNPQK